jgi:hypothetical protein
LARRYWGILSVAIERDGADNLLYDPPDPEFTSPVSPFPDTVLAGNDATFGVDAPNVSRFPPSIRGLA